MKAVKEAAPGAVVEDECVDICGGPIKVEIIKMLEGKAVTLYETDQRNLFSKYADRRTKAIAEIKDAVEKAA